MSLIKYFIENFKIAVAENLEYKFSSILFIILQMIISLMNLIVVYSIYELTSKGIPNWNLYEIILMIGINNMIVGMFNLIFHLGFIKNWIIEGEFDGILTKPIHPILQTIKLDYYYIGTFLSGIILLIFSIQKINLIITPIRIILFITSILLGDLTLFSLDLLINSIAFFSTKINSIEYNVKDVRKNFSRWPLNIYPKKLQWFFIFIFPLSFFGFIPASIILGKTLDKIFYYSPIGVFLITLFAFKLFNYGISKYSGTGS